MTVYHGSTYLFEEIDVRKGKPYKDFGRGFYVTRESSHAINLAIRNRQLENKYKRDCEAYLYTYNMNTSNMALFKVKEFKTADLEWLKFVIANRKKKERTHGYDIVMGPTANDETMAVINVYLDGLYGEIDSDDALLTLLKFIKPDVLPRQIYFATNEATSILLPTKEVEIL